jgi:hypothetical protein
MLCQTAVVVAVVLLSRTEAAAAEYAVLSIGADYSSGVVVILLGSCGDKTVSTTR